jgi:hypothetical protein
MTNLEKSDLDFDLVWLRNDGEHFSAYAKAKSIWLRTRETTIIECANHVAKLNHNNCYTGQEFEYAARYLLSLLGRP